MTVLRSSLVSVVSLSFALVACKGETVVQPDPQTKTDLDACLRAQVDKDKLIKTLQDENANLMREKGAGSGAGEVIVTIEGEALKIKANKTGGGGNPPIDPKLFEQGSKDFINLVEKSRGSIQKCYEGALKKDTSIQARTITLRVSATFSGEGAYKGSSFDPSLGAAFDECMKGIATKWVMPKNSPAMTFRASVSLTPS